MTTPPAGSVPAPESCHSDGSEEPPHLLLRRERSDVPITYNPTACLSCIFPKPPTGPVETCDTAGILSTAVNLAPSLQATEALTLLPNQPHLMHRTLFSYDLWTTERSELTTRTPTPACTASAPRLCTPLARH